MIAVARLFDTVVWLFTWVLIVQVVMSWLIAFNVVNTRNRFVYQLADVTFKLTEPALRPIRRILPNLGGIDISPVVLILLLQFANNLLREYVFFH